MREYKAGIYLRLSKEDRNKNNSIDAQRQITLKYAKERNYIVENEYIDNGYSGILDSRPALDKMINDIIHKNINMVIVKDLSRLTRDKNKTGFYTDIFFPDNDVRFISVTEYIDSGVRYEIDDTISLRGIINQSYLEDISKKIKAVKTNFKKEGKFIETSKLYGYKKDPNDKYKLIIDEEPAKVVKKIFEMYIDGIKPLKIAEYLNNEKIKTPSEYKQLKVKATYWTKGMVNRILNESTYTGRIILNKYYNDFKLKKKITTKKSELEFIENVHEAIITNEEFKKVSEIKRSICSPQKNTYEYLLKDLVYCKNCGRKMLYKNSSPVYINEKGEKKGKENNLGYFLCAVHYRHKDICNEWNKIMEQDLNKIVINQIIKRFKEIGLIDYIDVVNGICKRNLGKNEKLKKLNAERIKLDKEFKLLYSKRVEQVISDERFKEEYSLYQEKVNIIKSNIEEIEIKNSKSISRQQLEKIIEDFKNAKKFTNNNIKLLVSRIEIGKNNEVNITLKF